MLKRVYNKPKLLPANISKISWFPLAAAIGAVVGYKATTALIEDDHTQSKRQKKLPEVRS